MKYDRQALLDQITVAGAQFDGHVTNGSATALADLFEEMLGKVTASPVPRCPHCASNRLTCINGCTWAI